MNPDANPPKDTPRAGRTLLVRNAHTVVTMDAARRELHGAGLYARDGVIEQVGPDDTLPQQADEILDLGGRRLLLPGLVNTHHHFFQIFTRTFSPDGRLFPWLRSLYPVWARLRPEHIHLSARACAAELLLSGCTTTSDHLYLLPNGCRIDDEIAAMQEVGMRFTAVRGSMSIGESAGGLPPDALVEDEASILDDCQRLIETWHDPRPHAMLRIALGPCAPFTVSEDLMRETAALARAHPGVRLHTHLAENDEDLRYMLEHYGSRPEPWAERLGWLGPDVWHAHCVQLDAAGIARFARTGTGVAHCPCSNQRLASGAAPVRALLDAGVAVGLGVDGPASNDACNLLHETRQALLLARLRERDPAGLGAREALELATRGGAAVLGRDDIGILAPGKCADFITVDLDRPELAGAADPVAAVVLCQLDRVDHAFVAGRRLVDQGRLTHLDHPALAAAVRAAAGALLG